MGSASSPPGMKPNSSTAIEIKNLKEQVKEKADETWTKDMLEVHKEKIDEAKTIALATKKDFNNRVCQKEETIREMMKAINGFKNVKIGVVIVVFLFLAGGAGQFFMLRNQTNNMEKTQKATGESLVKIEEATDKNTVMFKEHIEAGETEKMDEEEERKELLDDIRDVVKKEIKRGRR